MTEALAATWRPCLAVLAAVAALSPAGRQLVAQLGDGAPEGKRRGEHAP